MSSMDKSVQKEYEDQLDMFATPGYKDLIDRIKVIREQAGNVSNIQTTDEFLQKKGAVEILDWLINWESSVRMYPPDE